MLDTLYQKTDENISHIEAMLHHAAKMADSLKLNEQERRELLKACELHDIGKIKVDASLFKQKSFSKEAFSTIKKHTEFGYRIANAIPELKPIAFTILTHHENVDGSGYPFGLTKDAIPLHARIIRIIDSYNAMRRDTIYRKPKTHQEAIKELNDYKAVYYDTKLVDMFINIFQ
jgi:HD-GYP domain-containing protein (c-di-GMP phosphodiesterase class II)